MRPGAIHFGRRRRKHGCFWHASRMIEPSAEATGLRTDLPRLTSLRAFAALAVFGFHCGTVLNWAVAQRLAGVGYVGVSFFFVLSGFVFAWSIPPGRPARDFYRRRLARVYTMHLVTASAARALFSSRSAWAVVSNLLLVHAWGASPNTVQLR